MRLLSRIALVLAFAGQATAQVLLPGTQPRDGSGHPDFPDFQDGDGEGSFVQPSQCSRCHEGYRAPTEPVHEVYDTWAGSLMANAARDPLFWAALDIANQDDALLGDVGVGDFCLRCHLPTAWYEGRSSCDTPWGEEFDGSCALGDPSEPDNDFEGITCHHCHRMYDASVPPAGEFEDSAAPYRGNAQVFLSTTPEITFGPFSDVQTTRHGWQQLDFFRDSAFCGQCHDVTSPALNRRDSMTGVDLGYPMPIERTYSEWTQSAYADDSSAPSASCQQCHLPQPDLDGDGSPDAAYGCREASDPRGPGSPLEGPYRTHAFVGANAWMLEVLDDQYGEALNRSASYQAVRMATLELLQERTVEVELTAPALAQAGDALDFSVRVTNLAGHKFPTGYPEGRRAWVHVAAGPDLDGDGALSADEIRLESGAWDSDTAVLQEDPQLKVYEVQLGIWDRRGTGECDLVDVDGEKMFHFVLNDCVVSDDRIPPLGFSPNAETAPVAYTYPENPARPGTLANWDDSPYSFVIPEEASGPWLVEASVRHQTTSRDYVEFLRDASVSTCDPLDEGCDPTMPDARPNRGEKMFELWDTLGKSAPIELSTVTQALVVDPAPSGACCVGESCFDLAQWECSANAGSWAGEGVDCALVDCSVGPELLPGEARDFRVSKGPGASLALDFTPACDALDHALVVSGLPFPPAWSELHCGLGVAGTAVLEGGNGSQAFLVLGRNGSRDGSLGTDSRGAERPENVGLAPCDYPQELGAPCD